MVRATRLLPFLLVLTACGQVQDTRPGQPVAHRQAAFKDILKAFEPIGVMLREERFDAKEFQTLAVQLTARRDAPWQYFGKDTDYPPSHAKPEVWSDGGKFEASKKEFFRATDQLAAAAPGGDQAKVEAAYKAVYDSCKSCHKQFKDR